MYAYEKRNSHTYPSVANLLKDSCSSAPLYIATHCNNVLQHTATPCNILQHPATNTHWRLLCSTPPQRRHIHCNTLQHTATPYNTLQHPATNLNTHVHIPIWVQPTQRQPQQRPKYCNTLQHSVAHLQHTGTTCNAHAHPARHFNAHICTPIGIHSAQSQPQWRPTHCSILQHIAMHCDCNTLQCAVTHCTTLHNAKTPFNTHIHINIGVHSAQRQPQRRPTHHSTPQHTATQRHTLQHPATPCNTLQHTSTHAYIYPLASALLNASDSGDRHTATHCNTLRHIATPCNTLQHLTTHSYTKASTLLNASNSGAPHSAIRHNTPQHTHTHAHWRPPCSTPATVAPHTTQHATTHRNTLQHTATHTYTYPFASTLLNASHNGAPLPSATHGLSPKGDARWYICVTNSQVTYYMNHERLIRVTNSRVTHCKGCCMLRWYTCVTNSRVTHYMSHEPLISDKTVRITHWRVLCTGRQSQKSPRCSILV